MGQRMNPEVKEKWVEALRSGEYKQGTNYLRSHNDRFCCLGVLCDIAEKEGIVEAERYWEFDDEVEDDPFANYSYDGTDTSLPIPVRIWAGLDPEEGWNPMLVSDSCIQLNDSEGFTFEQIADEIEEAL